MENNLVNIGGVSGDFSLVFQNEHICGMEQIETYFFSNIFDHSKDIVERNEFVYNKFEILFNNGQIDEIENILDNSALLDAHGSIIKTLVILSSSVERLNGKAEKLDKYLIEKFGH